MLTDLYCDPWPGVDDLLDIRAACATLTDRQREVLALSVEGYTQREIGERLGIAQQTVGETLAAAREKLHAATL